MRRSVASLLVLLLAGLALASASSSSRKISPHDLPNWMPLPLTEAYGQVLNRFHARINNSDHDIAHAVEYVLGRLSQGGLMCPAEQFVARPRVVLASKHIIEFTKDGETPWILQFTDVTGRLHQRSVILGINYHFSLEWDEGEALWPGQQGSGGVAVSGVTVVHRFVVTRDRSDKLSLLSHTVHRRPIPRTPPSSDSSCANSNNPQATRSSSSSSAAAAAAATATATASSATSPCSVVTRSAEHYWNATRSSVSGLVPSKRRHTARRLLLQQGEWLQMVPSNASEPQPYSFRPLKDTSGDAARMLATESGPPGRIVDTKPFYFPTPGRPGVCPAVGRRLLWPSLAMRDTHRDEAAVPDHLTIGQRQRQAQWQNPSRQPPQSLRIVTYNVWNVNSFNSEDYEGRIEFLARQILAEDPDIFALQEVRHDVKRDRQPETFAELFRGYTFVYQSAMSYPEDVFQRVEEGIAIFSKFPIVQSAYILLPREPTNPGDVHQRICLQATVDHPSFGLVNVFATHLSLDESARDLSVVRIVDWMKKFPLPQFLMGDLNAEPNSPAMRYLASKQGLLGQPPSGLYDVWLVLHPEPRTSYEHDDEPRDPGLTFNALEDNLVKRIDYVFANLDTTHFLHTVDTVPAAGAPYRCPDLGIPASDHLGLSLVVHRLHA